MRIRSLSVALSCALGLCALAAPSAHADGDAVITDVVVGGGGDFAIGINGSKTFNVSVTARDDSGIKGMELRVRFPGTVIRSPDRGVTCASADGATRTCTARFTVSQQGDLLLNEAAGTWYVQADVDANDGNSFFSDTAESFRIRRLAKLSVNAAPEPVKKNAKLTVTGKLIHADWFADRTVPYAGRSVKLQFRKKGSSTYNTVKTIKSSSTGALKTTVKATADGYWRWTYAGDATNSAAKATGDYVDVK
ncbi:calcium-binding protein [Streptomyces ipomoeae]|uniref:Calcium-binding protein n=1 Tax=Streptomyces ipomoeae TaxID=103232 RepID=A0AAE8VYV8_9ACTN|nr:calcium-binding protein [Streptomyces ipomoeae]TQE26426.1 calcium-binding protein [Streptomyces ipomoeae]TQE37864.1 calcium-binding protein [Streptomyces ipomoeae]